MKILKIFLVCSLILVSGFWLVDILHSFKSRQKNKLTSSEINMKEILFEEEEFTAEFPDPFFCKQFMYGEKKSPGKNTQKPVEKKKEITLPRCSIGGIVYNHENSMAIFISGDKSQLVKQGDVVDSIKIVSIMPKNIEVSYKGKKFKITQ